MKILLAIDDSKFSRAAAKFIRAFAPPRSQIRVLHVLEPPSALIERGMSASNDALRTIWRQQEQAAQTLTTETAALFRPRKLAVKPLVVQGDPRSRIVDVAAEWKADLIVVGSHGRKGLERFLMGSVSDAVVHHAPCSVTVVRPGRRTR